MPVTDMCHPNMSPKHVTSVLLQCSHPHKNVKPYKEDPAFPTAWGLCLQYCNLLSAILKAMFVLLLQLEQCEWCIICSLTSAVISLVWMTVSLPFFKVRSSSWALCSKIELLFYKQVSQCFVCHVCKLTSDHHFAINQQCTKQQVTAAMQYHIYHKQKGLEPFSWIPA